MMTVTGICPPAYSESLTVRCVCKVASRGVHGKVINPQSTSQIMIETTNHRMMHSESFHPTPSTPLDSTVKSLAGQVSALEVNFASLMDRLELVMQYSHPKEADGSNCGSAAAPAPKAHLIEVLDSYSYRLQNLNDKLAEIHSRLVI